METWTTKPRSVTAVRLPTEEESELKTLVELDAELVTIEELIVPLGCDVISAHDRMIEISNSRGMRTAYLGDWILRDESGNWHTCPDREFRLKYAQLKESEDG